MFMWAKVCGSCTVIILCKHADAISLVRTTPIYAQDMSASTSIPAPVCNITGANIPEELFERILDFLDKEIVTAWFIPCSSSPSILLHGKERKRALGRCILTSRYWATRCQPRIFEIIHLESKANVDQLLSLLESPLSRISGYIKKLILLQYVVSDSMSWMHLVPLRLLPKLSPTPRIELDFWGVWEETHSKRFGHLRSIHYMLHTTRPEFSSHISHLNLYNLRFRSFEDLAHLVGELRSLQALDCADVTWSSPVPDNYIIPVCPPSLDKVIMHRCTESTAGVLFLMGKRRRMLWDEPVLPFRLDRNENLLATQLIQNLASVMGEGGLTGFDFTLEKIDSVYHISCAYGDDSLCINFFFPATTDSENSDSELHVEIITIELDSDRFVWIYQWQATDWDWKKSDTLASRLPDLQKVVLAFTSQSDMTRFVDNVVNTQMKNLREAGKLRYAIFDERKTKQWMRISPGSDGLEPTALARHELWRL